MIDYSILIKTYNDDNELVDVVYHEECNNDNFMWSKKHTSDLFLKIVPNGYKDYLNGNLSNDCITKGPIFSEDNFNIYTMGPTAELIGEYLNLKNIMRKKKIKNKVNLDPTGD